MMRSVRLERRRSHSRSPLRRVSRQSKAIVNMLDKSAILKLKEDRDRPPRETFEERKKDEDEGKAVLKLLDPQIVPRSAKYFGHDDRNSSYDSWRGRGLYDPKLDHGRRNGGSLGGRRWEERGVRSRDNWDGYGNRPFGMGRDTFGSGTRNRDDYGRRGNVGAEGMWTHDKFLELSDNEDKHEDDNVVVVDSERAKRVISE